MLILNVISIYTCISLHCMEVKNKYIDTYLEYMPPRHAFQIQPKFILYIMQTIEHGKVFMILSQRQRTVNYLKLILLYKMITHRLIPQESTSR